MRTIGIKREISVSREVIVSCIALLIVIFSSCTAPIDIDTDDEDPRLVVYGTITDSYDYQSIRLSSSSPYFQMAPNPPMSEASVTITSLSENIIYSFREDPDSLGFYVSEIPWSAKPGERYDLKIELDFDNDGIKDVYEANTTVPDAVSLDSIAVQMINIMGYKHYSLNVYGQDPDDENYYMFNILVNDSLITNKMYEFILSDDVTFAGQYINGLSIAFFEHISNMEDTPEDMDDYVNFLELGDKIEVRTSLISKGYFDFVMQCNSEQRGENPMFGGPASNITTNISNGAVGYFSSYCISSSTSFVEEE